MPDFRRMTTRDPWNHIFYPYEQNQMAHGAIATQEWQDYVLKWCYAQIDAGVDSLFMDEVQGAYGRFEGYDDASIADFRNWLIKQYCAGKGWKPNDERWQTEFKVPLDNKAVCPDGTMNSFNYREYLIAADLAADPAEKDNPFQKAWGHAGQFLEDDTYCGYRHDRAWKYVYDSIHQYAAKKGRPISVNANGLNHHVDFQVQGFGKDWLGPKDEVQTTASFIRRYRATVLRGNDLAGHAVPTTFFHDWGFGGFPFRELKEEEQIKWIRTCAPEIYAAGGFYVFPVQIPGERLLSVIQKHADFYQAHKQWFHGGEWLGTRGIQSSVKGLSTAVWQFPSLKQRVVHIINHNYADKRITPQRDVLVKIPSAKRPASVTCASPDLPEDTPARFEWADGQVTVTLDLIDAYTCLALTYEALPEDYFGKDIVTIDTTGFWARPKVSEFTVGPDGKINDAKQLCRIVQGNLHLDLHNNPTFIVDYPRDGQFTVHVNSVASLGAKLLLFLDDRPTLDVDLPDMDKKNDNSAGEYDQDFSIPVPAGKHKIRVDNTGGDWFSVDFYEFAK
jgi:hypothetical protein